MDERQTVIVLSLLLQVKAEGSHDRGREGPSSQSKCQDNGANPNAKKKVSRTVVRTIHFVLKPMRGVTLSGSDYVSHDSLAICRSDLHLKLFPDFVVSIPSPLPVTIYRLRLPQTFKNSIFSSTPSPTLFTLPNRARSSATLSNTCCSSALTSPSS